MILTPTNGDIIFRPRYDTARQQLIGVGKVEVFVVWHRWPLALTHCCLFLPHLAQPRCNINGNALTRKSRRMQATDALREKDRHPIPRPLQEFPTQHTPPSHALALFVRSHTGSSVVRLVRSFPAAALFPHR